MSHIWSRCLISFSWFNTCMKYNSCLAMAMSLHYVMMPWITKNCHKTISDWFVNHWESSQKWFQSGLQITKNHQESPQNNFRPICESPKLQRIAKNHQELPQKWFQSGSQITKNCFKNDFRAVCESPRIIENHWELPQNNFRLICESPRIAKNYIKK